MAGGDRDRAEGAALTNLDPFSAAAEAIFATLGTNGWLTTRGNTDAAVKVMLTVPSRDELVGDGPTTFDPSMRFIDLTGTAAASGDLVTVDGTTWILSRSADSDSLGLVRRWIGVPFGQVPALSFSYHASGYPLVTWNGSAWVAP